MDKKDIEFKGDLPEIPVTKPAKPRIHVAPGESSCISCEG